MTNPTRQEIITTHKTIYNRILEILGDHDG